PAWPPRLFGFEGPAARSQRPGHHHRLDAQGRSVRRRSARAECRRRGSRGGVLMSRIGKKPVAVPAGVTATLEGRTLSVKGPKGTLSMGLVDEVSYAVEDGSIQVQP